MLFDTSEWLVTDQRGAFAMGTSEGVRTRKYHGFLMGIPGRSETAFLADLDMECNGTLIWPHSYLSPEGPIFFPVLDQSGILMKFTSGEEGPTWTWRLSEGHLSFRVRAGTRGGDEPHLEMDFTIKKKPQFKRERLLGFTKSPCGGGAALAVGKFKSP